jgi:hypothetical protein
MGSHESEQVLSLLNELSVLKTLDAEFDALPQGEPERDAHRLRQQRQQQISEEIKGLAEQKKNGADEPSQ